LLGSSLDGISAPLFLAFFDGPSATMKYVNAGPPLPFIVHPQAGVTPLGQPPGSPLGSHLARFQEYEATIPPDAALVVCSEGVTRARSPQGDEFGDRHLMHILKTMAGRSANKMADFVAAAVREFQESLAQQDDITTFVLVNRK